MTQSNSATAGAAALNGNETDQSVDQSQAGGAAPSYADEKKPDDKSGSGSDYTQVAGQAASNDQDADADATAVQVKPSNTASSIRVLSPGNDGDVSQSNDATAVGIAANGNKTDQSIEQSQGGSSAPSDARKPDEKSYGGSSYTQVAGQEASNTPGRRRGCDGGPGEAVATRRRRSACSAPATAATSRSRTAPPRSRRG